MPYKHVGETWAGAKPFLDRKIQAQAAINGKDRAQYPPQNPPAGAFGRPVFVA